jgi:hypothetical protein
MGPSALNVAMAPRHQQGCLIVGLICVVVRFIPGLLLENSTAAAVALREIGTSTGKAVVISDRDTIRVMHSEQDERIRL